MHIWVQVLRDYLPPPWPKQQKTDHVILSHVLVDLLTNKPGFFYYNFLNSLIHVFFLFIHLFVYLFMYCTCMYLFLQFAFHFGILNILKLINKKMNAYSKKKIILVSLILVLFFF